MTWAASLVSLAVLITIGLCVFWLIKLGKQIAKGEASAKREVALDGQIKEKNKYINDIDRLSQQKSEVKNEVRKVFSRGATLRDLLPLLNRSRGVPKVPKGSKS